jgi:hypothetical protein
MMDFISSSHDIAIAGSSAAVTITLTKVVKVTYKYLVVISSLIVISREIFLFFKKKPKLAALFSVLLLILVYSLYVFFSFSGGS